MTALPGPTAEQWNKLARRADNIFATREWSECWWRHHGRGAAPLVLVDDDRDPRIIVPLYVSGRLLRQVRFIGSGPADQLGPVCAFDDMGKAANLIRETLFVGRKHRWDVLVLHDVPEQDEWQRQLVGHEIRRTPSPFERFRGTSWDAYLASKSKNFREQVRRRERRLREAFSVVLRLATRETIGEDMTTLFRLHTMRWGQDAGFANGAERRLHEDFAQVAVRQGWLRLWLMELDGVPAGAVYGFRFGQAEYYYQSGRDPGFDSHSIGFVLLGHAMRCALEDGMTEYRLLRGDEDYKSRFASHERTLHSVAIARGRKGRAAIAVKESLRVGRSQ